MAESPIMLRAPDKDMRAAGRKYRPAHAESAGAPGVCMGHTSVSARCWHPPLRQFGVLVDNAFGLRHRASQP